MSSIEHAGAGQFSLYNGIPVPVPGYGTFRSEDGDVGELIRIAADAGYRHIDTAAMYGNEKGVGEGIRGCGISREDLFVTTKIPNPSRGYEKPLASFRESMEKLDIDYLDLLLIHWPANKKVFGDDADKVNADTWQAFEELYEAGKVRAIGVSNFKPHHLAALMKTARIKPMVDQIEYHPGFAQPETLAFCKENGILVEAWSPLGRMNVMEHALIRGLAEKYGRTPAQICLRWEYRKGILPLPKSGTPERIVSNLRFFDFDISEEDCLALDALHDIGGPCLDPDEMPF